jgi:hypothetical protein
VSNANPFGVGIETLAIYTVGLANAQRQTHKHRQR